ncbi:MAG TPA: hypothetical protein VKB53_01765 [Gammaproteobacteria bacterium]|nr:hypothetical protein [Gammaproteobacteria bacterium]
MPRPRSKPGHSITGDVNDFSLEGRKGMDSLSQFEVPEEIYEILEIEENKKKCHEALMDIEYYVGRYHFDCQAFDDAPTAASQAAGLRPAQTLAKELAQALTKAQRIA